LAEKRSGAFATHQWAAPDSSRQREDERLRGEVRDLAAMATTQKLAEVISKQLRGDKVASWFKKPIALRLGGDDPNFEILNQERLGKLDQMKRRGKSIPKKGAGKRSKK